MCRWLAYTGSPIQMESVLFKARHSLIDQSLHARMGATTTNGDGFGLGCAPSMRRCSSPTSARPPTRRPRKPTAIRFATGSGCSCTTASSAITRCCGVT